MARAPFRWLARNLGVLILALLLAVVVWASAVITTDPNEEQTYRPVSIEVIGQDPNLLLVNEIPSLVRITLRAPRSIWEQLDQDPTLVEAWIDLSGLGSGEHQVEVKTRVDANPVRFVGVDPQYIHLTLEPLVSQEFQVQLTVEGELPLGYQKDTPSFEPLQVRVSGAESVVSQVVKVNAFLDISGSINPVEREIQVEALDANNEPVTGVSITPKTVSVSQPISLLGGFKNVVVKVVTTGQVANGYRLTNVSVSPATVTLFSDNPQLMDEIPGFVDTLPVDLTGLNDDVEINVGLNLPQGVNLVREPSVLVQVSVAAIEGSITLTLPIEIIGLSPELAASISPANVDVIIAGPLNILDTLTESSFRVVLDLTGLPPGTYQRSPIVDLIPDLVRVQTTLPDTVEVIIVTAPTPTPTATGSVTPPVSGTSTTTETPQP